MKKLLLIIIISTLNSFAHDIKNAKIGSTVIIDWRNVGHSAIVINEYKNNSDSDKKFIIGSFLVPPVLWCNA